MREPVGFDQDPQYPEGTGTFRFSDGSELYAHEPDTAKRLREQIPATPDERTAENAHAPRQGGGGGGGGAGGNWWDAGNWQNQAPTRTDAAPAPGAGGLDQFLDQRDATGIGGDQGLPGRFTPTPRVEPSAAPEAPPGAPPAPAPGAPTPRVPAGPPPPRPRVSWAGVDPARMAEQGVPVPVKQTTSYEGTGAPYSLEDAQAREDANQRVVGARLASFDAERMRAEREAAQHAAAIPELRYQASRKQAALGKLEDQAKVDRAKVRTIIEENDKSATPDPGRFFKNAGTLPTIGMIIGQALGAYAATVSGSPNFAQQIVQAERDRDMQAQEEEIKLLGRQADNMLARLADQFEDVDMARSAYKLITGEMMDREIQGFAAEAKRDDVTRAAQSWLAMNQQERLLEEQRFRDLSIGKVTRTTQADVVQPKSGGSRAMTDEEVIAKQTKDNKARAGLLESENELGYQGKGGEQAGKLAKRGAEAATAGAAGDALYVEGYGNAKTKEEAVALRAAVASHKTRLKMLDRMAELNDKASAGVPGVGGLSTDARTEAQQLANQFETELARSYLGPITDSDRKAAREQTPDPSSWFSGTQKVKIRTAREASERKLDAELRGIVSGAHPNVTPEARE